MVNYLMTSLYFDTSALVKRYVEESGSQWVNALFTQPSELGFVGLNDDRMNP